MEWTAWMGPNPMLKAVTSGPNEISEGCQFPTGPNTTCGVPIPARGRGPGAPRLYCDHPDHNAQKARSELAQPSLRPVTDGMVTLVGLLDRYEHLCGELAAVAADAADVLAELTDPATVEREIAEIQRHATRRITAAEQGQADAEKASAAMARRLERAVELEQLAFAAAEEATANTEQATARLAQSAREALLTQVIWAAAPALGVQVLACGFLV
jgi:hypothetical protein